MPSSARPPGLNLRQHTQAVPQGKALAKPPPQAGAPANAAPATEEESADDKAALAGGFHESSYELQHGLQVSESEWPGDVTVPGALGDR